MNLYKSVVGSWESRLKKAIVKKPVKTAAALKETKEERGTGIVLKK